MMICQFTVSIDNVLLTYHTTANKCNALPPNNTAIITEYLHVILTTNSNSSTIVRSSVILYFVLGVVAKNSGG